jgi:hypothetical protein
MTTSPQHDPADSNVVTLRICAEIIKKAARTIWRLVSQRRHSRKDMPFISLALGLVDIVVLGFLDEQHADHKSGGCNHNRIPQTVVDIAL